jgi:hypothetical protein
MLSTAGGGFFLLLIPESGRVPTLDGRLSDIGGWLDLMGQCPGQFFFAAVTATVMPARVGVPAAARMVLAGERLPAIFFGSLGDGHADRGDEVGKESHTGSKPAELQVPPGFPAKPEHGNAFVDGYGCLAEEEIVEGRGVRGEPRPSFPPPGRMIDTRAGRANKASPG